MKARPLLFPLFVVLAVAAFVLIDRPNDTADKDAGQVTAKVTRVVDGDTVKVLLNGREDTVRYIGVDTPESVKPGTPVECYAKEASRYNKSRVEGRGVRLSFDHERRDRYGRLLAYIYLPKHGQTSINEALVSSGYARAYSVEPNTRLKARLSRLQSTARGKMLGLWGACGQ